ncbi:MAG TPA: NAD-dependent epimerase/dehydratase family protein [Mariniphaga anaerophila]|uniref:NAD-dependent epimerase/dehydratase family protein n=1 Tax=Mariniphaga anaerophila TaxID=1484053 RepID=A0A831LQF1_9BACT|nr:NAD-dependent epimerase/dehydratase family protein [Mariniphaga anaerophila]
MNILITGAFGFVGTNLSRALSATGKHRLIALDLTEPKNHRYNEFVSWVELHTLNGRNIDAIIHLAGKAHDTKNTSEEKAYFDVNVGLTKTIFEKFLTSNAQKFIFFSSVKAVADTVEGDQLSEDDIPKPGTPYGKSKLEAEQYLTNRLMEWEQETGSIYKQLYILRPAMIHGPGNKGNLNLLYKLVSKGIPCPLGAFENKRSFTSIDNVAFVVHQIIEKNIESGIYNLADDEPLSTNQLIELIAQSKGKKANLWKIPQRIILVSAKLGGLLRLPLNPERLKKLIESYVVSNQKIKQTLSIDKMPISAEDGIIKTLKSFK